jgi:hypothetical protein
MLLATVEPIYHFLDQFVESKHVTNLKTLSKSKYNFGFTYLIELYAHKQVILGQQDLQLFHFNFQLVVQFLGVQLVELLEDFGGCHGGQVICLLDHVQIEEAAVLD